MAIDFEKAFRGLKRDITAKKRRAFLDDVQGQIDEDEELEMWIDGSQEDRYVAVTFDRRKNDGSFSYHHFDLLLVALDALAGGNGIYKPSSQMRALKWRGRRSDLERVLRRFRSNNRQLRYHRLLVLPFPLVITGQNIDKSVYRS